MSNHEKLDGIDDEWNIPSEIEVTQGVASCVVDISRLWDEMRTDLLEREIRRQDREFLASIGIKNECE